MNWKALISYFWEIPVAKYQSQYSGLLTVEWANGRKVLNSPRANYSFDRLHRVLQKALSPPVLETSDKILLLGLGAGSAVEIIRKDLGLKNIIHAVDIDPVIIEIAENHFNLREDHYTKIICEDAEKFVADEQGPFQWIICDLFIDDQIPENLWSIDFLSSLSNLMPHPSAQTFVNVMQNDLESEKGKQIISWLMRDFNVEVRKIKYGNFGIYISKK